MNMKEIAAKAGVSTATVSYVINRTGNVSDRTRQEILRIIEEEGYSPNRMAKGLRERRTYTVGVLAEDITAFQTPRIINGINSYMESRGYHILLSDMSMIKKTGGDFNRIPNFKKELKESLKLFKSAQVDGIVYVALHDRDVSHLVEGIREPFVYTYCYDVSYEHYCVTYDNKKITKEAIQHLISCGHKEIGIIWGRQDSRPAQMRFESYRECLKENGLVLNVDSIYYGDWGAESGGQAYKVFCESARKPTAVFAMNDLMAIGFMDAAQDNGWKLPEELEVIGFDNRESCRYHRPKMTTIDLPLEHMGAESGKTVLELIEGKNVTQKIKELPCSLLLR